MKLTIAIVTLGLAVLTGCSTAKQINYQSPYCYTDQTITKDGDNTVASQTVVECTDRPGQQTAIQRAGIDASCKEFWYNETRWGTRQRVRGVMCEKLNGTYEIVDIDGSTR